MPFENCSTYFLAELHKMSCVERLERGTTYYKP